MEAIFSTEISVNCAIPHGFISQKTLFFNRMYLHVLWYILRHFYDTNSHLHLRPFWKHFEPSIGVLLVQCVGFGSWNVHDFTLLVQSYSLPSEFMAYSSKEPGKRSPFLTWQFDRPLKINFIPWHIPPSSHKNVLPIPTFCFPKKRVLATGRVLLLATQSHWKVKRFNSPNVNLVKLAL
jgi:hypothetical protein